MQGAMLLKVWVALALVALTFHAAAATDPTAYQQLEKMGFPRGLLPLTVVDYSLQKNGSFVVHLAGECTYTVPGQSTLLVKYANTITGLLQSGKLEDLRGTEVKAFFGWRCITSIEVSDNKLKMVFFVDNRTYKGEYPIDIDDSPKCDVI